jgi:hypothetical protein
VARCGKFAKGTVIYENPDFPVPAGPTSITRVGSKGSSPSLGRESRIQHSGVATVTTPQPFLHNVYRLISDGVRCKVTSKLYGRLRAIMPMVVSQVLHLNDDG